MTVTQKFGLFFTKQNIFPKIVQRMQRTDMFDVENLESRNNANSKMKSYNHHRFVLTLSICEWVSQSENFVNSQIISHIYDSTH
jgi:hypothetical protein